MLMALLMLRPSLQGVAESIAIGGNNVLGFMSAGTLVGGGAYLALRRPAIPRLVAVPGVAVLLWALASLTWSFNRGEAISDWIGFALYLVVFGVAAAAAPIGSALW